MKLKMPFVAAALGLLAALAGCTGGPVRIFTSDYGAVTDAGYRLPSVPITKIPRKYHRQVINYETDEVPGTIIVDTREKFLYLVMEDGKAIRYGIGVGRQGFEWSGVARVAMKRAWPIWTPPAPMIRRQPELAKWAGGMPPGLTNPLGARALYLFNKRGDTGYRLHGTPVWNSIGKAVSSGCIRLLNQDIMDLYNRTEIGAKVVVKR